MLLESSANTKPWLPVRLGLAEESRTTNSGYFRTTKLNVYHYHNHIFYSTTKAGVNLLLKCMLPQSVNFDVYWRGGRIHIFHVEKPKMR